jgi:hypothetical protein
MQTRTTLSALPPIIPVNDETRAMLEYATSPEGRTKIEKGRQEIRNGKGIVATPGYFASLGQRISERVARNRAA